MRRPALRTVLPLLLAALPAQAQTLRTVVVPPDATVVIAPRGQPAPGQPSAMLRPVAPPVVPAVPLPPLPPALPAVAPLGLAAVPGLILPLAAAALLGAGLPGSGSSGSAPAATR